MKVFGVFQAVRLSSQPVPGERERLGVLPVRRFVIAPQQRKLPAFLCQCTSQTGALSAGIEDSLSK